MSTHPGLDGFTEVIVGQRPASGFGTRTATPSVVRRSVSRTGASGVAGETFIRAARMMFRCRSSAMFSGAAAALVGSTPTKLEKATAERSALNAVTKRCCDCSWPAGLAGGGGESGGEGGAAGETLPAGVALSADRTAPPEEAEK